MTRNWLNLEDILSDLWTTMMFGRFVFAQYCTIPGACVCFLDLVVCGVVACFPRSRQHLDRVSFRFIIYALIFQYALNNLFIATLLPRTSQLSASSLHLHMQRPLIRLEDSVISRLSFAMCVHLIFHDAYFLAILTEYVGFRV
jgi:hypothetical protein